MTPCAYCGGRGHQTDHYITKAMARRSLAAARERENPKYKVRCCITCNVNKGTSARVAPGDEHLIPELEKLTFAKFATYDGGSMELVK